MNVGRNDPCPCGSGRKYKKCCMQALQPSTPTPREAAAADVEALIVTFRAGDFAALERQARALIEAHPDSGMAWKTLAVALSRQGKDALDASERAAALLPDDAEAHNNLGLARRLAGHSAAAAQAFGRALAIAPGLADAHRNLATVQYDLGRFDEAAESCRRAIALQPRFAAAHVNLGNALCALGRPQEAIGCFERALQLDDGDPLAHINLGNALSSLGRNEDASASYARAIGLQPDSAAAHAYFGIAERSLGHAAAAQAAARRALALDPGLVPALLLAASLSADEGAFGEAIARVNDAIRIDPSSAEAQAALPAYRRMTVQDAGWSGQAERLAAQPLPPGRQALLHYALGKYCDDTGAYERAFDHYRRANDLRRATCAPYDAPAMERFVDRLIDTPFPSAGPDGTADERAAFIVGMPRCGSSLAEQILASHPAVHGAGELTYWRDLWARQPGDPGQAVLAEAGARYRAELDRIAGGARRVIDKMPYNFLYLGLIHAALPGARIIHLRRDPLDTALSIYFQDFGDDQPYARDLDAIAHYYRQYLRIMRHWRRQLPAGLMLELGYEDLVGDVEGCSRRMVAHLGLDWDPACLDYQRTARRVTTASVWQVRQKVHGQAVGRWRHYERFLGPLLGLREAAD